MNERTGRSRPLLGGPHSLLARGLQLCVLLLAFIPRSVLTLDAVPSLRESIPWLAAATAGVAVLHQRTRPRRSMPTRTDDVGHVTAAVAAASIAFVMCFALLGVALAPAGVIVRFLAGGLALLVTRGVIRQLATGGHRRRLVVIGTGVEAREAVGLLSDHPEVDVDFVGVIGDRDTADRMDLGEHWIGDIEDLDTALEGTRAELALVTITGFRSPRFRTVLSVLRTNDVEPMLTTGVAHLDAASLRVGSVSHEPMVSIDWRQPGRVHELVKRSVDIVGSTVGLVFAAPVFALAAVAIKLDDQGPIFYRSPRVGRGGETFGMLKFRSMTDGAHDQRNDLAQRNERSGPLFKVSNDPRITRVGRVLRETSIDEIPQFWNVLRGDMSLVGPRPALPEEAAVFDDVHSQRFSVLPGVTGLWQVEARSNANFSAYRRLDLHYIGNLSLRRDAEILVATVVQVAVVLATLPFWWLSKRPAADAIDLREPAGVIDLNGRLRPADSLVTGDVDTGAESSALGG